MARYCMVMILGEIFAFTLAREHLLLFSAFFWILKWFSVHLGPRRSSAGCRPAQKPGRSGRSAPGSGAAAVGAATAADRRQGRGLRPRRGGHQRAGALHRRSRPGHAHGQGRRRRRRSAQRRSGPFSGTEGGRRRRPVGRPPQLDAPLWPVAAFRLQRQNHSGACTDSGPLSIKVLQKPLFKDAIGCLLCRDEVRFNVP